MLKIVRNTSNIFKAIIVSHLWNLYLKFKHIPIYYLFFTNHILHKITNHILRRISLLELSLIDTLLASPVTLNCMKTFTLHYKYQWSPQHVLHMIEIEIKKKWTFIEEQKYKGGGKSLLVSFCSETEAKRGWRGKTMTMKDTKVKNFTSNQVTHTSLVS